MRKLIIGLTALIMSIVGAAYAQAPLPARVKAGNIIVWQQTVTPASVATVVCAEQNITISLPSGYPAVLTTDTVFVNPAATGNATSMTQARISATNTVSVMYCNPTAGSLTPGSGTYTFVIVKR